MPSRRSSDAGSSRAWEDLRREARRLEGDLDSRLAAYAKLASGFEAGPRGGGKPDVGGATDAAAAAKAADIEGLLQRLSDVNDDMGGATSGYSDSRAHVLARHRDILAELTQEYRRLKAAVGAARDRASLLGGSETSPLLSVAVHSPGVAALRERGYLLGAGAAADEALATAQSVSAGLLEQRRTFEGVGGKLGGIGEAFPAIGGLLTAIRRKKSRDTLVLSGVVAICVFLLILFLWSR